MLDPINGFADTVLVRKEPLPGICRIVGLERKAKLDELMAPGQMGAYLIYRGRNLARFGIEVTLGFIEGDYDVWASKWLATVFKFPKGPVYPEARMPAIAYDVIHPALADAGISKFALESIKGPDALEHGNLTRYTLNCVEFVARPRIQSGKVDAPQATPEDPGDKLVREATEGFKSALADSARAWKAPP